MSKKEQLLTESQVRQFMKLANLTPLTPGFVDGLTEKRDKDWGHGEHEYRRHRDAEGHETKSGEGPEGHYKDYEGPYGGGKREKSKTDPGREDYTWRKGRKSKTKPGHVDLEEGSDADIEESHGRGRGEGARGYGDPDDAGRAGARLREEDEYDEHEEENAEDDLEHADDLEDDAAEDLGDIGMEPAALDGGREVSVDDFLAALEVALENVLGDEVEVDQEEEVEDEAVVDLENGDEMELEMGAVEEDPALQEMISTITKRVAKRIVKEALQTKKNG